MRVVNKAPKAPLAPLLIPARVPVGGSHFLRNTGIWREGDVCDVVFDDYSATTHVGGTSLDVQSGEDPEKGAKGAFVAFLPFRRRGPWEEATSKELRGDNGGYAAVGGVLSLTSLRSASGRVLAS